MDPSQRELRQQQNNAPTPLRRQRLPKGLGRGATHDAIEASADFAKRLGHSFILHTRPTAIQENAFQLLEIDPTRVQ